MQRFAGMPVEFYRDWASVAVDEARHFQLLQNRLAQLGFRYGDFKAHNGLWEMAEKTRDSCLARMALVPRLLEARGLDVTPGMIDKLRQLHDPESVAVLEVILCRGSPACGDRNALVQALLPCRNTKIRKRNSSRC